MPSQKFSKVSSLGGLEIPEEDCEDSLKSSELEDDTVNARKKNIQNLLTTLEEVNGVELTSISKDQQSVSDATSV